MLIKAPIYQVVFSSWAKEIIVAMKALGIIEVTGENIFKRQKPSKRTEPAKAISKTLKHAFR